MRDRLQCPVPRCRSCPPLLAEGGPTNRGGAAPLFRLHSYSHARRANTMQALAEWRATREAACRQRHPSQYTPGNYRQPSACAARLCHTCLVPSTSRSMCPPERVPAGCRCWMCGKRGETDGTTEGHSSICLHCITVQPFCRSCRHHHKGSDNPGDIHRSCGWFEA